MMNRAKITIKSKRLFQRHFEWVALMGAVLVMALMNPYVDTGLSWCLFERAGVPFCPGEGLGHSIAFIFRGDFGNAFQANALGPFALIVLGGRILYLIKQNILIKTKCYGKNDRLFTRIRR